MADGKQGVVLIGTDHSKLSGAMYAQTTFAHDHGLADEIGDSSHGVQHNRGHDLENHNALEGLHLLDLSDLSVCAKETKQTALGSYKNGSHAATDAAHNYAHNVLEYVPNKIAFGHHPCHDVNGNSINGLGRGNDAVLECVTVCKHTADLAKHRVIEHNADGPCPDSTGSTDQIITNQACVVSDETDLLTSATGEGRDTIDVTGNQEIMQFNVLKAKGAVPPNDLSCDVTKGSAPLDEDIGPTVGKVDKENSTVINASGRNNKCEGTDENGYRNNGIVDMNHGGVDQAAQHAETYDNSIPHDKSAKSVFNDLEEM